MNPCWSLAPIAWALTGALSPAQTLVARVSMEQPQRHFFQVALEVRDLDSTPFELVLPVWTPGSYKIRDYSRNLESFRVHDGGGRELSWTKTAKNRWRIDPSSADAVVIEFDAFALEASVRHSWLGDTFGFLMPGSVVPYIDGAKDRPYELWISPPEGWQVDTALEELEPNRFRAEDYDRLVDCPVQIGTHERHDFEVEGTRFRLTLTGDHNMDVPAMLEDMAKVCAEAGKMFGGFPFERYWFLTRFTGGGGGLEHSDSTALMTSGWRFDSRDGWRGFLGLVAHEFFHAWNVKRIRDRALGPFDYEREVYTRLLWVHEGWTNYYAAVLNRRAGITSDADLRKSRARLLNGYLDRPGRKIQSLAQASFDAWIKHYQTNETTRNSTVSYYSHGQVAALCFDCILRHHSENRHCLDDVMRRLFDDYAVKGEGITEESVKNLLVEYGGDEAEEFWRRHVVGVEEIEIDRWLRYAGLEWKIEDPDARKTEAEDGGTEGRESVEEEEGAESEVDGDGPPKREPWKRRPLPDLGFTTAEEGRSLIVRSIERDGVAWHAGIDLGDELIALDDRRISSRNWSKLLQESDGGELPLTISRRGRIVRLKLPVPEPELSYSLEPLEDADALQRAVYQGMFDAELPAKEKSVDESRSESSARAGSSDRG